jgi:choline kinase
MKAIILSAGQGKRLLSLTEKQPKCMLPVIGDQPLLEVQLRALAACGVDEAVVMVGFGAAQVDAHLAAHPVPGIHIRTFFNPFYAQSDNLATVWLAQPEMTEDFLILNGDTLFEAAVLERLLSSPRAPLTVTVNCKDAYDSDDMKVTLDAKRRLLAVSKTLPPARVHAASIGLMRFCDEGIKRFQDALDEAVRRESGLRAWYLSVVDQLASSMPIETAEITGLWWGEVDSPEDLANVRAELAELARAESVARLEEKSATPAFERSALRNVGRR